MDQAIADLHSGQVRTISEAARKHGLNRSTLSRRYHRKTASRTECIENSRLLGDIEEREIVKHIHKLTSLGLPPTPAELNKIAAALAGREPSKNWCSRFVRRHRDELDSGYWLSFEESCNKKAKSKTSSKSS